MSTIFFYLLLWWSGTILFIWMWKHSLFRKTWQEPYFRDTPVVLESDDWGPGGAFHAERLQRLERMLLQHADSIGRPPVLTVDMVLSVPDVAAIKTDSVGAYHRKYLDESFPGIYEALKAAMRKGVVVPQLHGLEHLNSDAFLGCYHSKDPRVAKAFEDDDWWDWEALDSPLQAHYVNGRTLPTIPEPKEKVQKLVKLALNKFQDMFGAPSLSTVAPCYLWNGEVERAWGKSGIRYIQTAGYRCTGRDAHGKYIQDPPLIRLADSSDAGQLYLIRNVMYEPVDGNNTVDTALREALVAHAQAMPITVSTHRYNYTRSESECNDSIDGLDRLLSRIEGRLPRVRYLSSPELGEAINDPEQSLQNLFNGSRWPPLQRYQGLEKIAPFFQRLRHRHPKMVIYAVVTGLIVPAALLAALSRIHQRLGESG